VTEMFSTTRARPSRRFASRAMFSALVFASPWVATSAAADDVQACIEAHEQAQVARKEGRLLDAREKLLTCAKDGCPAVLRKDCGPWLNEVTSSIPTVVVLAKGPGGEDLINVRVFFDGEEIATKLDGMAIDVDPGVHDFRFETEGEDPVEQQVVIREGVKNHELAVQFGKPETPPVEPLPLDTPPGADVAPARPIPTLVYVLGGVGVAGLAASVFFETSGMSKRSDLDDQGCKPYCPKDDVDAAKRDFLIGDIALGLGLASLGTATYFYVTRPSEPEETAELPAIDVHGVRGGAMATWQGRF
jgi:hypothetical protein